MQNLNENKSSLPKYLEELVQPTPLSVEKLIAAWDGLSFETKLMILSEYIPNYPVDCKLRICLLVIKSNNIYLRFLAHEIGKNVLDINLPKETSELFTKLKTIGESDESNLISGKDVVIYGFKCTPDEFFNLSDTERIHNISRVKGNGEQVAEFINYYYKNQLRFPRITENHILDILRQYFGGKIFNEYRSNEMSYDGLTQFSKGEDILALWNLVPVVSENIAYILIQNLPAESGFKNFTKDLIPRLPEKYLIWFLSNKNNYASDFRKSIFASDVYSKSVKEAAISCNFSLMDYEFREIVKYEPKKRFEVIQNLVFAGDLSVCIKKAMIDLLRLEKDVDYTLLAYCEQDINRKLRNLSPEHQLYHLNIIRIYEIAKRILPWNQKDAREINFEGEFDFLNINTKGLNTWEIFIKIRDRYEYFYKNEEINLNLAEMVELYEEANLPKDNQETFLLKRILKAHLEMFVKSKQPKNKNCFDGFKNEILLTINKENENQKLILNKLNDSINKIENGIYIIGNNTAFIKFKFVFVFIIVSFLFGFASHWLITR